MSQHDFSHCLLVADINTFQDVTRGIDDGCERIQVSRIGKLVDIHNGQVRIFVQQLANQGGSSETGAACNEYLNVLTDSTCTTRWFAESRLFAPKNELNSLHLLPTGV